VVITGGSQDVPLANDILARMQSDAVSIAGQTTLKQVGAVFSHAQLVVANDSGPMHIAVSLGTHVVALFGPTSPVLTGPYNAEHAMVVHDPRSCPDIPCYDTDHPQFPGMAALSVDQVFAAVAAALRSAVNG